MSSSTSSNTVIVIYAIAFLLSLDQSAPAKFLGLVSKRASSESLRNKIPCISSFHRSKLVPSNLLISKRDLVTLLVEAFVAIFQQ
ncbi:hypothetical protein KP509_23G048500 [Ceratopteris richardii]|uniref:Secreted protein n=1 Tax=Ceratopteris richardii TaxID=49495 RepID=A0A8T2S282_CERRI|nr:hypothetical protein KP509_1Z253800 [Ceratopteris richardii]KAH7301925.1 hypothetical protein KP509_23G048500 [Ceratopteris richardii]